MARSCAFMIGRSETCALKARNDRKTKTRHGDMVRGNVYLPRNSAGPFPVLLGASALSEVIAPSAAGPSGDFLGRAQVGLVDDAGLAVDAGAFDEVVELVAFVLGDKRCRIG